MDEKQQKPSGKGTFYMFPMLIMGCVNGHVRGCMRALCTYIIYAVIDVNMCNTLNTINECEFRCTAIIIPISIRGPSLAHSGFDLKFSPMMLMITKKLSSTHIILLMLDKSFVTCRAVKRRSMDGICWVMRILHLHLSCVLNVIAKSWSFPLPLTHKWVCIECRRGSEFYERQYIHINTFLCFAWCL